MGDTVSILWYHSAEVLGIELSYRYWTKLPIPYLPHPLIW